MRTPRRRVGCAVLPLLLSACISSAALDASFIASGRPLALPAAGEFPRVSEPEFEGMLVAQLGRPVVVNIWASWCGPCRVEAPLLQRASQEYETRVSFIGVNSSDARAPAIEFIKQYGLTYANVFDDSGDIRRKLGLRGFPTTYIFDRDGKFRASVVGGISEQRLAAQLRDALSK